MAAHRYWGLRLEVPANPGASYSYVTAIAEVEMRATPGGADQCNGGAALTAGGWVWPPARAFDNDASTYAEIQGFQNSRLVGYVFATPVTVLEVALTLPGATTGYARGSQSGPYYAIVQGSDDGVTWRNYGALDCDAQRADGATILIPVQASPFAKVASTGAGAAVLPASAPFSAAAVVRSVDGAPARVDPQFGGQYRIAGDVAIDGTPAAPVVRRVRLYHVATGQFVRETWGDAAGAFAFERIAAGEYLVVSDDHTRAYNAAVADRVAAVP